MARQSRSRLRLGRMFSPRSKSASAIASVEAQQKRRKARVKKWRERFKRFNLSSWHESSIVATVCNLFKSSAATARVLREATTGSQMVGAGYGRQLRIEGLEERQMLSTTPWNLATQGNFSQDWSNTDLITTDGDWSGVPSIVGYSEDLSGTSTGTDPQTILAPQSSTNVLANQTKPNTLSNGGLAEFGKATLLSDNFNSYANQTAFAAVWTVDVAPGGTLSSAQGNAGQSVNIGTAAARSTRSFAETSTFSTFANLGVGDQVVFSFDFYDESPTTSPIRNYARIQDGASSGANQLIQMGMNNNENGVDSGGQYYMASIAGYTPATVDPDGGANETGTLTAGGFFKLNDFGVGHRSLGWHNLKVVISTTDGSSQNYDFYVDNQLAERVTGVGTGLKSYDNVDIGSGFSSATEAFYDNVKVEYFAPSNPVVALNGSGSADAPNLDLYMNSTGRQQVTVSYNLRDIDGSADNTNQQVALQYRIGGSGNFINVPAAYVADASTGPSLATLVTPVSVSLPEWTNVADLQFRIITTNAPGNDEWIGVDDISVTSTQINPPTFTSSATPSVAENTTPVITLATTDSDVGQSSTFTITGGDDLAKFTIVNGNQLAFITASDFENPTDADQHNDYLVEVTADDGNGGTTVQQITVTVTDANEAPTADAGGPYATHEGDSLLLDATGSSDSDAGDSIVKYEWDVNGDGTVDFTSSGGKQLMDWIQARSLGVDDNGTYQGSVTVTDSAGNTASDAFTWTVDTTPPTVSISGSSAVTLGQDFTLTFNSSDFGNDTISDLYINWGDGSSEEKVSGLTRTANPDGTYTISLTRTHAYSAGHFAISAYAVDEDVPDSDSDNDGIPDAAYAVTPISVDVTAQAPTFSPPASIAIDEPGVQVAPNLAQYVSDDRTAAADITFTITGGADASAFVVNSHTSPFDLEFSAPTDFEHPNSANHDNTYIVEITATDTDGASTAKIISVTVNNINEAPVVVLPAGSITKGAGQDIVIDASQSYDPDAGDTTTLQYSVSVTAAGSSIVLYEAAKQSSPTLVIPAGTLTPGQYTFTVTATDAAGNTGSDSRALTIQATPPSTAVPMDTDNDGFADELLVTAGDGASHALSFTVDTTGPDVQLVVTDNGQELGRFTGSDFDGKVVVKGGTGDDTISIDEDLLDSGDWVFDLDGGDGNDALAIKGSRSDSAIYTPSDLNRGSGTIKTYFENGDIPSDDITFRNFEPVDISGMSTVTIASPANTTNSLQLDAGFDFATGTIPAIVVTGNTGIGMTGIEEAHLWDDTNVVIDTSATTGSGANTITVGSAIGTAPLVTNLTLTTNANGKVVFNADPKPSGTVTVNSPTLDLNADITISGKDTSAVTTYNVAGAGKIQDAIDLANGGETINVAAGTYHEALTVDEDVTIHGAGSATTHIDVGAAPVGVEIEDSHVVSISGVSVENLSSFGLGIDVKGSLDLESSDVGSGGLIGINVDASGPNDGQLVMNSSRVLGASLFGVQVGGSPTAHAQINLSEIAGTTIAIIVSNGVLVATNSKLSGAQRGLVLTSAGTVTITGSDFSGVVGKAVTNAAGGTIDASGNWWGTNSELGVQARTDGPSGSVDFTPFLDSGTDGNGLATGFVGDFSHVDVTTLGGQFGGGARVQEGVDVVTVGGIVDVRAGTYHEDVNANKSVRLLGQNHDTTILSGAIGGDVSTIHVTANNVEIAGFTITRDGNNVAQWNDPNLNSAGIAVQGTSITGMVVHDNIITGNRSGIDINNSNGHTIRNNEIVDNRTGMILRNQTDNLVVTENDIANNFTVGIVFLDGSGGMNSPLQEAVGSTFFNNNLSGNWYGQIVDRQTGGSLPVPGANVKDFSGNWFGSNSPVITTANSMEPGYAAQIPTMFGGSATAPGGQPDIAGPASANFDITPLLDAGTDTNIETTPGRGAFGFQGDFSTLHVIANQAQAGATGRIQEGINDVTNGGTLLIHAGSYTGGADATAKAVNLVPGASTGTSPAQIILNGNLVLNGDDSLAIELNGTTAATQYDNFVVTGSVTLGGATLVASRGYSPFPGDEFILISNDLSDPVSGEFDSLPNGAVITLGGIPFTVSYTGGSNGNDVTLTVAQATAVYANDTWIEQADTSGGGPGIQVGDTVQSNTGAGDAPVMGLIYGYNAFNSIQAAIEAVSVGGTVNVLAGQYAEDLNVDKAVTLLGATRRRPDPHGCPGRRVGYCPRHQQSRSVQPDGNDRGLRKRQQCHDRRFHRGW